MVFTKHWVAFAIGARRVSERNLGRRCDRDGMKSRSKTVEEKVVVCDDLRGRQVRSIACEMRVRCQRHIVAKRNRAAASRIHAVFGHGARNDEMADLTGLKFFREARLKEGIGRLLSEDTLSV